MTRPIVGLVCFACKVVAAVFLRAPIIVHRHVARGNLIDRGAIVLLVQDDRAECEGSERIPPSVVALTIALPLAAIASVTASVARMITVISIVSPAIVSVVIFVAMAVTTVAALRVGTTRIIVGVSVLIRVWPLLLVFDEDHVRTVGN